MAPVGEARLTPIVTVTLSVRNGAAYLREAVESILGQTLREIELVAIDDASTDETPGILASFRDPRVRLLKNDSCLGLTRSLNRAWKAGTAPYIAHLDADDRALPRRLEVQARWLDSHPETGLVGSAAEFIDAQGRPCGVDRFPEDHERLMAILLAESRVHHSAFMYRRSLMEQIGGYDESFYYGQDFDLQWRVGRVSRLECVPEVLLQYRTGHSSQIGSERATEQLACGRRIAIRNLCEFAPGEIDADTAGRLFGILHGGPVEWPRGTAAHLAPFWRRVLGPAAFREIWKPRVLTLVRRLARRSPVESAALALLLFKRF